MIGRELHPNLDWSHDPEVTLDSELMIQCDIDTYVIWNHEWSHAHIVNHNVVDWLSAAHASLYDNT